MMIACLQFGPKFGEVYHNINRADAVLCGANSKDLHLDLIVVCELAFSGCNFESPEAINSVLEPSKSGPTQLWARTTAFKNNCVVTVGYPEVDDTRKSYSSVIAVKKNGDTMLHYRGYALDQTDITWAREDTDNFYYEKIDGLGKVVMGIPTKLHPREIAWWNNLEYFVIHKKPDLIILPVAWTTNENLESYSTRPEEPDMKTLGHWIERLKLVLTATKDEIIVIFANRSGQEGNTVYAGTSAVLGFQHCKVKVYGILGRGERDLLVVNTESPPTKGVIWNKGLPIIVPDISGRVELRPKLRSANQAGQNPMDLKFHTLKTEDLDQRGVGEQLPRPKSPKSRNASQDRSNVSGGVVGIGA